MQIPLLQPERRVEFDAELRRRAIRGGIGAAAAIALVTIFSGFTVSLVVAALIFLLLYVIPWDMVRYGRFVVPATAIVLAVLYPYYRDDLFEIPLFGVFPTTDTAVTMTIFIMMAIGLNIVVGYAGCSISATWPSTRWAPTRRRGSRRRTSPSTGRTTSARWG